MNSRIGDIHRYVTSIVLMSLLAIVVVACGDEGSIETTDPASSEKDVGANLAGWSQGEIATLRSLWLGALQPLTPDPSNAVGDHPDAVGFGHKLFFDARFSGNGEVSCATCHQPDLNFTDGLPLAEAIGTTARGTPTIVGTSHGPWFFWDGRRDSQWSQAMVPMESAIEHGGTRTQFAHIIDQDQSYREAYEVIFGRLPDFSDRSRFPETAGPVDDPDALAAWESMDPQDQAAVTQVFVNIGKAIAAYERQIMPGPSRFDSYVSALLDGDESAVAAALTEEEVAGLRLFLSRGNCTQCHNGPLLTNNGFHSAGVPDTNELEPDVGRFAGVFEVVGNEFNCLGSYSDADPEQCPELRFVKTEGLELLGAFKVPTLRNVAETGPYMHAGQFETLAEVLTHYNGADPGPTGHSDLQPLGLTGEELIQLETFLRTLSGPLNAPQDLLTQP
ncbi:MAG: cytochrome c peroxidase [Candidatus Promineifilaceae bacterium]